MSLVVLVGFALLLGCGSGSPDADVVALLTEFRTNEAAAKQKYQGKPVRIKLDKVEKIAAVKDGVVFIDGRVGKIAIWAFTTDQAEGEWPWRTNRASRSRWKEKSADSCPPPPRWASSN
jgi:hypothetical protein